MVVASLRRTALTAIIAACGIVTTAASRDEDHEQQHRNLQDGPQQQSGEKSLSSVKIADIMVYFFSGSAVVLIMAVSTYLFAMVMDKCWCFGEDLALTRDEMNLRLTSSHLARKAGLSTITAEDRLKVLNDFFARVSKAYESTGADGDAAATSDSNNNSTNNEGKQRRRGLGFSRRASNDSLPTSRSPSRRRLNKSRRRSSNGTTPPAAAGDVELTTLSPSKAAAEDSGDIESQTPNQSAALDENSTRNLDKELEELADRDHQEGTCAICLANYEPGEKVMSGTSCNHIFHYECAMEWMKKDHDYCPFCRKFMIQPDEFRSAAQKILQSKRFDRLTKLDEYIGINSALQETQRQELRLQERREQLAAAAREAEAAETGTAAAAAPTTSSPADETEAAQIDNATPAEATVIDTVDDGDDEEVEAIAAAKSEADDGTSAKAEAVVEETDDDDAADAAKVINDDEDKKPAAAEATADVDEKVEASVEAAAESDCTSDDSEQKPAAVDAVIDEAADTDGPKEDVTETVVDDTIVAVAAEQESTDGMEADKEMDSNDAVEDVDDKPNAAESDGNGDNDDKPTKS
mmetsp:Transcript_7328/g.21498  ORF Transcript_7328/g.21498 Transcript_7328/m.21498 type:complete len:579 (+) Transcript_7328:451-2187(+)|eukprot:CAMPEP_0119573976 /NCGR_PEP_ID=MMETSP1352-20130426/45390_1 /TAXON_ID=265584 /ORGANISM="Stauroneis constricta, Strain CCMP1120" /LENGTH=578 /DNA_ID=CAMNT_0007623667 /DNA_START=377 /DNA_END=2113 /DNA_ORIENTATION=+